MTIIYTIITAVAGLVGGILLAARTKKSPDVTYGKLDKISRITNILTILLYLRFATLTLGIGVISEPAYEGILGLIGWLVSFVIAAPNLTCGIGLGLSVALRKRGESKVGFLVQFIGAVSIGFSVLLYLIFAGNLISSLN